MFRGSCEHALESIRGGKETLMTLLEAFVYDPLVDWTPGVELRLPGQAQEDNAADKRDMHTELTFSMLSVRVAEIRSRWLDNQSHFTNALSLVEDNFNLWLEVFAGIQNYNEYLTKLHLGMSALKEAEANPSHRLYTLQNRFVEHNMVEASVKVAQAKITAFVEDNEKLIHLHQRAETCLTPDQIHKWTSEVATVKTGSMDNASGVVHEFLTNAGQVWSLSTFFTFFLSFKNGLSRLSS